MPPPTSLLGLITTKRKPGNVLTPVSAQRSYRHNKTQLYSGWTKTANRICIQHMTLLHFTKLLLFNISTWWVLQQHVFQCISFVQLQIKSSKLNFVNISYPSKQNQNNLTDIKPETDIKKQKTNIWTRNGRSVLNMWYVQSTNTQQQSTYGFPKHSRLST